MGPLSDSSAVPLPPSDAPSQVSDPVQHNDGMKKYTSYRVDVRPTSMDPNALAQSTSLAAFSSVLRRYSDFLWLFEALHQERAGAIVPPLPEKQPVGRFSPQFVEERRRALERFLRRVAIHPELSDAACLSTFLKADDVSFQAAKNAKGQVLPQQPSAYLPSPTKKDGIQRWFAEAKTSLTGDLVQSPDDDIFEEIHRYVHGLDSQMRQVSQQATGLVRKGKELANGLFEFGLAFNLLGQSEADALGQALTSLGETADRLSVLSAEHSDHEKLQFEEPLHDYLKTIQAVQMALQRRHEKRLTYSTCLAEVDAKTGQLNKLRSQLGQEAKAYSVELALRRAHEAAQAARDDFAATSQRVLREVDRFKREKAEEMRRTVLDYILLQVEHNKRMEEVWATLIPQLERADGGEVASPTSETPAVPAPAPVALPPTISGGDAMLSVQYREAPAGGF